MNRRVHLATGLLECDGSLLLVASRYPNQPEPLWNLPGGRQRDGELLRETVRREFLEETGLAVCVGSARYVSESYDRATNVHFLNVTFDVSLDDADASKPRAPVRQARGDKFQAPGDKLPARDDIVDLPLVTLSLSKGQGDGGDAHVTDLAWVPRAELAARLTVAVVREPLLAHLGDERCRYFGFADAGITIEFADPP